MRQTIAAAFVAAALVAAVTVLIGSAEGAEGSTSEVKENGARVTAQRGTTEALLAEATEWVKTQIDALYAGGTELRTGRRSYLDLHFDEANSFRIKADTQVRVDKVLETSEDESGRIVRLVELEVVDGEVNARLGRLPDDVRVSVTSPSAVAGASGTDFTVVFHRLQQEMLVKVVDHTVVVGARDRADKQVTVAALQQVEVRPWQDGKLTATGRAVLSEKELGKEFIAQFRQEPGELKVTSVGTAPAPDDVANADQRRSEAQAAADDAARSALADLVFQLAIDESTTVADVLTKNKALAVKVYELISAAPVLDTTFADDDTCTVVVQADLAALAEVLGRKLAATLRAVREVGEAEYLNTFGAKALDVTRTAAEADGKRRLRNKLGGSIVARGRTLQDEFNRHADVRDTVLGVVENAVVEEAHCFSDGSVALLMSCMLTKVVQNHPELVGTLYLSSPEPVVLHDFMDYRFMREHLAAVREGGGQTQGALAKAIVKMLGLEDQMDPNATDQDYASFLASMGAFPFGGWRVGSVATEEDLAVILVKVLGLLPEVDDPNNPDDYLALLRERGLGLGSVRNILGNSGGTNPLAPVVGGTPLSGLYQENVSTVRGF